MSTPMPEYAQTDEGPQETPQDPQETPPEPETFPRDYVERLRRENADYRTRAQRAEDLEARLRAESVARATHDVLVDPEALAWRDEFSGEDGYPDPARIREAAQALVAEKPYLGRVNGDVGLGDRQNVSAGAVDLAGMLRGHA